MSSNMEHAVGRWMPVLALALAAGSPAYAATLHVDDSNSGSANGSAKHPYSSIGAAISKAKSGDTILVAAGTYNENITISNKTLTLNGGALGASSSAYAGGKGGNFSSINPYANITRITGTGANKPTVSLLSCGKSKVDGFTISGGRGKKSSGVAYGGGVYCSDGSPTISRNVIEKNDMGQIGKSMGGGIYLMDVTNAMVISNMIRNNKAYGGAGIGCYDTTATIRGNTIRDNIAVGDHGGGMHMAGKNLQVTDNLIVNNEVGRNLSYSWGGGLLVHSKGSYVHLARNIVTQNYAAEIGSGEFIDDGAQALIENELIYANECTSAGGAGLYVDGADWYSSGPVGSTVTIINSTVAGHKCSGTQGDGIYIEYHSKVTIKNSIFWDNGGKDFYTKTQSKLTVSYTHSQQGYSGIGNSKSDCLFASPSQGDYHLKSKKARWNSKANGGKGAWVSDSQHSPCIDAGDPGSSYTKEPAPNGSRINLGTHGNTSRASMANVGGPPPDTGLPPDPDGPTPPSDAYVPPKPGDHSVPPKNDRPIKPGHDMGPGPGPDNSTACCGATSLQGGCSVATLAPPPALLGLLLLLILVWRCRSYNSAVEK